MLAFQHLESLLVTLLSPAVLVKTMGGVDTPEELSLCCCCAGVMTQTSSPALRLLS